MRRLTAIGLFIIAILFLASCSEKVNEIPDNDPFSSFNVSDIKIENYVNRYFIDIIGREPLDTELKEDVDVLKASNLNREVRDSLIRRLMNDTTFRQAEFSYHHAYIQNLYNLAKVRCLEGVADAEIEKVIGLAMSAALRDSLAGDWDNYFRRQALIRRNQGALRSHELLLKGEINYHEMFAYIVNNSVYDKINMNSFNFIRATFDQLLWRLPTEQEFEKSFGMIEFSTAGELFGVTGSNKSDYVAILTQSVGMLEGMVIWAFNNFMHREPSGEEIYSLVAEYINHNNIDLIIAKILVTDEYANFR